MSPPIKKFHILEIQFKGLDHMQLSLSQFQNMYQLALQTFAKLNTRNAVKSRRNSLNDIFVKMSHMSYQEKEQMCPCTQRAQWVPLNNAGRILYVIYIVQDT